MNQKNATNEDFSGHSNLLGQSENESRRTGECGSRHSGGHGYFRSEGRQKVVPTDESSSLHVKTSVPRGRESNLSRSSLDI